MQRRQALPQAPVPHRLQIQLPKIEIKNNSPQAGVLAKSGVLMKQDLYLQKEKMLKIYMHIMTHCALIHLIVIARS